jgi:hypothetical protein
MHIPDDEIEKAEAELQKAAEEIKHASQDLAKAEEDLEKAEHDLDEARQHHGHVIHFELDAEPEHTQQALWTPNGIIQEFGKKDPATNYLVRIEGGRKTQSYEGLGNEEIELRNGMCFLTMSVGPTPVSDADKVLGVDCFLAGLRELGFEPAAVPGLSDHIVFNYAVPSGSMCGRQVKLGFIVPADFPLSLPTGLHVSPHIHPLSPDSRPHPTGAIHEAHSVPFRAAGGDWQYWSRPCPRPVGNNKPVAAYMRHIWQLWDSQ